MFTIILCALCIFWCLSSGLVPWGMRQGIMSYITNKQGVLPFSTWVRILGTISPKCEAWGIWIFPKTVPKWTQQLLSTTVSGCDQYVIYYQWISPEKIESIWMNDFRWFDVKGVTIKDEWHYWRLDWCTIESDWLPKFGFVGWSLDDASLNAINNP